MSAAATAQSCLTTRRLWLTPLAPHHARALHPLLDDWEVVRMLVQVPWPVTRGDIEVHATRQDSTRQEFADFGILAEGVPIGICGVKKPGSGSPPRKMPRLGYWIGRAYWGRGYATEALRALVGHVFESLPDERIGAGVFADNPASQRVLEHLGFTETGRYEVHSRSRGVSVPTIDMQLGRAEWEGA